MNSEAVVRIIDCLKAMQGERTKHRNMVRDERTDEHRMTECALVKRPIKNDLRVY